DYQQGEAVRIMFVHVPAAWMATFVYAILALSSAVALIWRHPLADIAAQSAAPLGAGFTLLCLVTGSLWGEPMWGTWWVWDARRARRRHPGAGWRGQSADHQVLGRLVEHAAPAGERVPHRRPDHRRIDAMAAADHGFGLHAALHHAAADPHAHRAPRRQDPRAPHGGSRARGGERRAAPPGGVMSGLDGFLAMGGYAVFVWPAYA